MRDHAAVLEEPRSMGLPITNAKLAIWLFLATEIMFFSGLIGAYIVLRFGSNVWPTPHDVHLVEAYGAINTFVLICSSVTVVLAYKALTDNRVSNAVWYILVTLILAGVFVAIKAREYSDKWHHNIIPGQVRAALDFDYVNELGDFIGRLNALPQHNADQKKLLTDLRDFHGRLVKDGLPLGERDANIAKALSLAHRADKAFPPKEHAGLEPPQFIPMGNLWASLYFLLTGIHAVHVLGGMVIFILILVMAVMGKFGTRQTQFVELTGLYWHFVDIVWIFLFPLLYLIG